MICRFVSASREDTMVDFVRQYTRISNRLTAEDAQKEGPANHIAVIENAILSNFQALEADAESAFREHLENALRASSAAISEAAVAGPSASGGKQEELESLEEALAKIVPDEEVSKAATGEGEATAAAAAAPLADAAARLGGVDAGRHAGGAEVAEPPRPGEAAEGAAAGAAAELPLSPVAAEPPTALARAQEAISAARGFAGTLTDAGLQELLGPVAKQVQPGWDARSRSRQEFLDDLSRALPCDDARSPAVQRVAAALSTGAGDHLHLQPPVVQAVPEQPSAKGAADLSQGWLRKAALPMPDFVTSFRAVVAKCVCQRVGHEVLEARTPWEAEFCTSFLSHVANAGEGDAAKDLWASTKCGRGLAAGEDVPKLWTALQELFAPYQAWPTRIIQTASHWVSAGGRAPRSCPRVLADCLASFCK